MPLWMTASSTGFAEMGVRIGLRHAAMRCPARVAKADVRRWEIHRRGGDLAGLLLDVDEAVDRDADSPGVVAAILQELQGVENRVAELGLHARRNRRCRTSNWASCR